MTISTIHCSMDYPDPDDFGISTTRRGVLTTEHPSSSYGIPVLVLDDFHSLRHSELGGVRGTADIPASAAITIAWPRPSDLYEWQRPEDVESFVDRAIRAGYPIVNR